MDQRSDIAVLWSHALDIDITRIRFDNNAEQPQRETWKQETGKHGNRDTRKKRNKEIRKHGNKRTRDQVKKTHGKQIPTASQ